ncbi:initiation control protein YabA [Ruoffia tabacinasalis]|uniref:initiation control protein YabA n=1 Tax=Ruoffia tabacinasalis TaxID=87458 RepID=UPI003F95CA8C
MRDKNNYLEMFDEAETHLLQLSDTVAQLREVIDNLVEENNKLRMSNNDLKSLLIKFQTDAQEDVTEGEEDSQTSSGRESLLGFYNEGIHVCHEFFGSRRSSNEQCLFCQEILERLENHS